MDNELVLKDLQAKAARWNWLMQYVLSGSIRYHNSISGCETIEELCVVVDRAIEEEEIGGVYEEEEESA